PRLPPDSPLFPYTTLFRSTPQPISAAEAIGTSCGIGTACTSLTTTRSVNTDALANVATFSVLPSAPVRVNGRLILPKVARHIVGDRKSTRLNSSHLVISYA